jgi:hypothetical protein
VRSVSFHPSGDFLLAGNKVFTFFIPKYIGGKYIFFGPM